MNVSGYLKNSHNTYKNISFPINISLFNRCPSFPQRLLSLVLVLLLIFKVKRIIYCVPGEALLHSSKPVSFKFSLLQSLQ